MKSILLFLTCFLCLHFGHAQLNVDSLLRSSDWNTGLTYMGDSIVELMKMKPRILDTVGLNKSEKLIACFEFYELREFGMRIHFDTAGNLIYTNFLYCLSGATVVEIRTLKALNNLIYTEYRIGYSDLPENFSQATYAIQTILPDRLILRRIN
jgi:hypothetical protein